MESVERLPPAFRTFRIVRPEPDAVATWLLAATLVVFLCLQNGGYDPIPRDQIGIAVWWALLCGVAVGALPAPGRTRASLAALGLLLGFALWTALAMGWTESAERTATELARVGAYLGVLALACSLAARRGSGGRLLLNGVTFALALIAAIGVLSRLHMAWFPRNELGAFLPGIQIERRLSYPLNYSGGMGALAGIALPLLLAATASARNLAAQALAAAAIPLAGLALYLSTSGTGAAVAASALAAFLALAPDRLPKLATLAAGALGTAILAAAIDQRAALARGLPTLAAKQQGNEVLAMALVVCAGVALIQVAIGLALRYGRRPRWLRISRSRAWLATAVVVAVTIPAAIAAGAPGGLSRDWQAFKGRGGGAAQASASSGILNPSGSGRYQFWRSALAENATDPWVGTGPGTFELWWARNGSYGGFVRDAHSLYLQSLAELGIVGLVLIGGFVLSVLAIGIARTLRSPPDTRLALAAATAGCAGFAVAAALEWVWQIAALATVFMLLAGVVVAGFPSPRRGRERRGDGSQAATRRILACGIAIAALAAIWLPLRGASALLDSQADAARGDLAGALSEARSAAAAQPYAASPVVQEALVFEREGRLRAAALAARAATHRDSLDWRTWLTLSRIEAERGMAGPSVRAYRRARSLNPKSGLFAA
ncbi:MAG TPA: O-antigen ligase family protein [Solirubrobacterales bacterium]|jgi:hypothetical protein|nr:O-antigen ligase family protein [Solirubrobacterales bacterium]